MVDLRPGLNGQRLVRLMSSAITRCQLDLSGAVVFTEAASGAFIVTAVLAAMAGARHVYALTRTSRYGTAPEIGSQTLALAHLAGVREGAVEVVTEKTPEQVGQADIITNSGHVRPIDACTVNW